MTENPENKKEEEKRITNLHLDISLEELMTHVPDMKVAEDLWKSKAEMSEEYKQLHQKLQILAVYMARNINEGPEVKDNISKRLLLARSMLGIIVDNLAVTAYDVYGILTEMTHDTFMRVTGRRYILQSITAVAAAHEAERQKQADEMYE